MTERGGLRERQAWIAVTAVLATSLFWLASAVLVLLLGAYAGGVHGFLVVMRALARAALHLGRTGGPLALAALGAVALTFAAAVRLGTRADRSARHG